MSKTALSQVCKALGLLLLLLAQQGAVEHELSHFSAANVAGINADSNGAAHGSCALCPAFAQVVSPAFSYSAPVPLRADIALRFFAERHAATIDLKGPQPRSRGPPASS